MIRIGSKGLCFNNPRDLPHASFSSNSMCFSLNKNQNCQCFVTHICFCECWNLKKASDFKYGYTTNLANMIMSLAVVFNRSGNI